MFDHSSSSQAPSMTEPFDSNFTQMLPAELQTHVITSPVITEGCETPTPDHSKLFTINESKSIGSPYYSDLGKSTSVDYSNYSPKGKMIRQPCQTFFIDEERGDGSLEIGDMRCYCVPSRVHGLGDFLSRTWSWFLLNKEQILSSVSGTFTVLVTTIGHRL